MASEKILVVDDEKNIRLTVAQALEPLGYRVKTAFNGEDALMQLEAEPYDLILCDLKMPGMDGMQLLSKAVELYPEIAIAMISAHGTVDNAVEAMKLGAVDFLQKPFTPRELRDLVDRVFRRKNLESEPGSDYELALEAAKQGANKRQFEQAVERAKKAIAIDPSRPEAFNFLGELQEMLGDKEEGLKNYRVAVGIDPAYEPARNNLSRATREPRSRPSL
ncbi:MAG: response regulator [Cyanobacteriota bacterium]|nr:response regulator [Cyanobacteriota bacterium]